MAKLTTHLHVVSAMTKYYSLTYLKFTRFAFLIYLNLFQMGKYPCCLVNNSKFVNQKIFHSD